MFRIHDILVWIRIPGSMPLTNGSGFGWALFANLEVRSEQLEINEKRITDLSWNLIFCICLRIWVLQFLKKAQNRCTLIWVGTDDDLTNGFNGYNVVSLIERGRDMLGPPSTPRTTQRNIRQGLSLVSAFLPRGPPSSSSIATPTAVNTLPAPSTSPKLVGLTKPSYTVLPA